MVNCEILCYNVKLGTMTVILQNRRIVTHIKVDMSIVLELGS
jgi:hypothetical protein